MIWQISYSPPHDLNHSFLQAMTEKEETRLLLERYKVEKEAKDAGRQSGERKDGMDSPSGDDDDDDGNPAGEKEEFQGQLQVREATNGRENDEDGKDDG